MDTRTDRRGTGARAGRRAGLPLACALVPLVGGCPIDPLDRDLRLIVDRLHLAPMSPPAPAAPEVVRLGEVLFFDRELSGNRDIACATCHHPLEHSGDGLSLSVGTGGEGVGPGRSLGQGRRFVPRHSPELFNRGAPEWTTLFWDGRVERIGDLRISTPAEAMLPSGLDGVLAAQALFPVTSRHEMRGSAGDVDVRGTPNELAAIPDTALPAIWDGLMRRLMRIPGYVHLFAETYPDVPAEALGIQHAANAIAAYEAEALWFADSPWDAYLGGDRTAMSRRAKRGALIFFGKGRCATCHTGRLFTDQRFHNVGTPQLGPGKGDFGGADHGRALVTGRNGDRCAFRTPSLRNVALTGPWMHDGAYVDLEAAVRHMADPARGLRSYDPEQLRPELRGLLVAESEAEAILATLDPVVAEACGLVAEEISDLVAFLSALTDPAAEDLSHLVPAAVPSGLPVDGAPPRRARPPGSP